MGEAKFLRSLFYFYLTDFFGGVPIYDEKTIVSEDFANMLNPRSSIDEVRKFILKDLDDAIATLPTDRSSDAKGRVTQNGAYALKGKVLLYAKRYAEKKLSTVKSIPYIQVTRIYLNLVVTKVRK